MSDEFDTTAAEHNSAAAPEPETPDVDAGGGDFEFTPADAEAGLGADAPSPEVDADPAAEDAEVVDGELTSPEAASIEAEPVADDRAAQYLALAQRTQADFENYKKRAARDAALAQQRGISKLAKELLPALDNLERALSHASSEDPLLEGIKLVQTDLLSALTRAGIQSFDPAGESFDPNVHEAVAQLPQEGVEPGTVIQVYQQGYRLGDTVLRPARVVVSA